MRSFDALNLGGHVPLKLGHDGPDAREDPSSQFALGWVTRIYREGRKLLADFSVPEKVAEWVKEGFLRFVSVELLQDVKADTREIPWVLDAVALLGADQPAVGILKSLSLTMARSAGLRCRGRVAFTRDPNSGGHRPNMADDPNKGGDIAALMARLDKLEAEKKQLELKAAERESFERKLQELEKNTRDEKIAAHRKEVLALFEAAIKDKRIQPAARERFKRSYRFDTDSILDVQITDVETFIKENPNPDAPKKVSGLGGTGEVAADARADERIVSLAQKFIRENPTHPRIKDCEPWQQLQFAAQQVMRSDADLGREYKYLPSNVKQEAA